MNTLINQITTAISGTVLFAAAVVMTGLGFALVATLAVFAFVAMGVALVATPFIGVTHPKADEANDAQAAA